MLLAVGTYIGSVIVINIVSREKMIIGENIPTFEPVWDIAWQFGRNEKDGQEHVVATFDDGRITSYSVQRKLEVSIQLHCRTNVSFSNNKKFRIHLRKENRKI